MPLLIDGHNLIGRMSDICLDHPDDEIELVQQVRRYCRRRRRRATIVFDRGLPGGRDPLLSAPPVEVVFASRGSTADGVIRQRIRRARDPRGLLVVSSDRAVLEAAQASGARVVSSETFAAELILLHPQESTSREKPELAGGVEEWLELFGGEFPH
ncbi:MAG: NYN domain-containing protein [Anaerolineae bacterium]|nr:NYN domain-containing protein [Anaerolineae bacterium]